MEPGNNATMTDFILVPYTDPILRLPCRLISDEEIKTGKIKEGYDLLQLIKSMAKVMRAKDGIGIAAPQVGIPIQFAIIVATGGITPLINPEVALVSSKEITLMEGCLSYPGFKTEVARPVWVDVWSDSLNGHRQRYSFEGTEARCALHEIDHLNGKVIWEH